MSLSGTVDSQTYTMTINGKSVSYTAGGADTVSIILLALETAWNASTIPEMTEYTADATPDGGPYTSLTLTADTSGIPGTISVATGGGATFSIAHTTSGTGPNDFTNAQNWSTGTAPANSDVLIFDYGIVDCLYNLSTSLTGLTISVEGGFSANIGLPAVNESGSVAYSEYRTRFLTIAGGTLTVDAPSVKRCNVDFGANTATVRILDCGPRVGSSTVPVILINGGNASSTLDVSKGDIGLAYYRGDTARFDTIRIGFVTSAQSDSVVYCGLGTTLASIAKNGGVLTINSNVTTLTQETAGGWTIVDAGAVTTAVVQGGTLFYNSTGTLGTVTISNGATLTFDGDTRAKTVTNPILIYGDDSKLIDNQKVVNSGTLSFTTQQTRILNVEHGAGNVCQVA